MPRSGPLPAPGHLLHAASLRLREGGEAGRREAAGLSGEVIRLLEVRSDAASTRLLAGACRILGLARAAGESPTEWREAVEAFDRALAWMRREYARDDPGWRAAAADLWMQRGLVLLQGGARTGYADALASFDEAIGLREAEPATGDAWGWFAWLAGWMNRADTLTRMGGLDRLESALAAHAIVLARLPRIPVEAHPEFRRRHAIAWLNRGLTFRARCRAGDDAEALRSFDRAIALSQGMLGDDSLAAVGAKARINRAASLLNLDGSRAEAAHAEARAARAILEAQAEAGLRGTETLLAATVVECRAAARLLVAGSGDPDANRRIVLVRQTRESAMRGLQWVATWESQGESGLRGQAADLLRSACQVAIEGDPSQLPALLQEGMAVTGLMSVDVLRAEVVVAWQGLLQRVQCDCFPRLNSPGFQGVLASVEVLETVRLWLQSFGDPHGADAAGRSGNGPVPQDPSRNPTSDNDNLPEAPPSANP